jgi:hypothetical protein
MSLHLAEMLMFVGALRPSTLLRYRREAANISFIVFGLSQPGLQPNIYHTWRQHANHYTIDVFKNLCNINNNNKLFCIQYINL